MAAQLTCSYWSVHIDYAEIVKIKHWRVGQLVRENKEV